MSRFPLVQDPCPYKGPIADILAGSQCRLCEREVHDLTAMSEADRRALFAGCSDAEGLCVRYTVRAGSAVAAAMLGVAGFVAAPAMAQAADAPAAQEQVAQAAPSDAPAAEADGDTAYDEEDFSFGEMIIVGGLRKPDQAQWHSGEEKPAAGPKLRTLPVITEDAPAKAKGASEA
ncbi:MAG: hypothetical protein KAF27_00325 [Porphyrobacter sp.]|nr:hypothetical protein [Porphyrobacter sp.]